MNHNSPPQWLIDIWQHVLPNFFGITRHNGPIVQGPVILETLTSEEEQIFATALRRSVALISKKREIVAGKFEPIEDEL